MHTDAGPCRSLPIAPMCATRAPRGASLPWSHAAKTNKYCLYIEERRCTENWLADSLKPNVRSATANAVENESRPNLMASPLLSVGIGLVAILIQCWPRRNLKKMRASHRSLSQTIARRCRPGPARLRNRCAPGRKTSESFPAPNAVKTEQLPTTSRQARNPPQGIRHEAPAPGLNTVSGGW